MATWVALLRAVNLGSRNKVPMAPLRAALEDAGYGDVRTVVASGNVVFERPRPAASAIEQLIAREFGVTTTVVLRSAAQIRRLAASHPFERDAYVAFTTRKPTAAALQAIDGLDPYALVGADVVLHFPRGYANAQLTGAVLEKRLGIGVTVRNWRTVEKLAQLVA